MVKSNLVIRAITLLGTWLVENADRVDRYDRVTRETLNSAKENYYKLFLNLSQLYPKEIGQNPEMFELSQKIEKIPNLR